MDSTNSAEVNRLEFGANSNLLTLVEETALSASTIFSASSSVLDAGCATAAAVPLTALLFHLAIMALRQALAR